MLIHRLLTLLFATMFCVSFAQAHSGASGVRVDQTAQITLRANVIEVTFLTELNREGAYLEVLSMDLDGDGKLSLPEQAAYFTEQSKEILSGLELSINGKRAPLQKVGDVELSMPFRKRYRFEVPHPEGWQMKQGGTVVEFYNDNFLDYPGNVKIELDPGVHTDIVFDSRCSQDAAVGDSQERDVVFQYRPGRGVYEPRKDTQPIELAMIGNLTGDAIRIKQPANSPALPPIIISLLVLCAVFFVFAAYTNVARRFLLTLASLALMFGILVSIFMCGDWVREPGEELALSKLEAGQIFQKLHGNIYRAFESRTESEIYDTLAEGLEGDVLDEVYDDVHEALRVRDQEGTNFHVRRVRPMETEIFEDADSEPNSFLVRFRWRVYGTVTHFDHKHARFNEYEALYRVCHVDRGWRITESRVQQQESVARSVRRNS